MSSGAITFLGIRVPRMPKPDPMRVAWFAQIPVAAALFAAAANSTTLPRSVAIVALVSCFVGGLGSALALRGRRRADVVHAVLLLMQTILNSIAFGRMIFWIEDPSLTTRMTWAIYAVLLVFNVVISLHNVRRR